MEARSYDRVDGTAKQTGFVAQEVYESGALDREAGEEEARPVGLGCFSGPKGAITPGHT